MQDYYVRLESEIFKTYRCQRAANSLDIDAQKKAIHELKIKADVLSEYSIGLVLGASGSGKTTLAQQIWGHGIFNSYLDQSKPVIDQFPIDYSYDQCAELLSGIGLTSVPCWIRPCYTLSNGQKARAEAALSMAQNEELTVLDEWTSVVDRTVAKVMSHCVSKFARKNKKKIVLLSCHYDVIEWLDPDWIIDCNTQQFIDRRLLSPVDRSRKEKIDFTIREVDGSSWKYFSKYHYLSYRLPGGKNYMFGLFVNDQQIGFQCFSAYTPYKKTDQARGVKRIYHSNRTVIHPDYAGFGLGIRLINETSRYMQNTYRFRIMAKFSSTPVYKSMIKQKEWRFLGESIKFVAAKGTTNNQSFERTSVKMYSFEFKY